MKTLLKLKLGIFLIGALTLTSVLTQAQTIGNGPYYATPSWDQQLPASTRFIVLSNWGGAAVLDPETGLVWERAPDSGLFKVTIPPGGFLGEESALTHCHKIRVGNRAGWRLPSVEELGSLLDSTQNHPALPVGHPF